MFEELLEPWDGEEAVIRFDTRTRTWTFVLVHSTHLGPAAGGTRMKVYARPDEALADGLRLSAAMTRKLAVAGLPLGGGKAVLAVRHLPEGAERRRVLLRYADVITSLDGRYHTGPDMNTGEEDMDVLAERCPYVYCRSPGNGGSGSTAPATAVGVLHGIRASLDWVHGSPELAGRSVLVQGVGAVGAPLAHLLAEAGADVAVSDVAVERATAFAAEIGARVVAPDEVVGTACDVYAPCAVGAVLSSATIPRLRCVIVAGAANNQLATDDDAERLQAAGIWYAPDFVINAGGAISATGLELLGEQATQVDERLARIGDILTEVYRSAARGGTTTEAAAVALADARLDGSSDSR